MTAKIAIIDDDPKITKITSKILERDGYEVETFNVPEEGLSRVLSGDFDLIILDVMMPKMSGYELFDRLRGNEKTKDVPVLLLTAKSRYDVIRDRSRYFLYGLYGLISKPYQSRELLFQVRDIIRLSQRRRAELEEKRAVVSPEKTNVPQEEEKEEEFVADSDIQILSLEEIISAAISDTKPEDSPSCGILVPEQSKDSNQKESEEQLVASPRQSEYEKTEPQNDLPQKEAQSVSEIPASEGVSGQSLEPIPTEPQKVLPDTQTQGVSEIPASEGVSGQSLEPIPTEPQKVLPQKEVKAIPQFRIIKTSFRIEFAHKDNAKAREITEHIDIARLSGNKKDKVRINLPGKVSINKLIEILSQSKCLFPEITQITSFYKVLSVNPQSQDEDNQANPDNPNGAIQ